MINPDTRVTKIKGLLSKKGWVREEFQALR